MSWICFFWKHSLEEYELPGQEGLPAKLVGQRCIRCTATFPDERLFAPGIRELQRRRVEMSTNGLCSNNPNVVREGADDSQSSSAQMKESEA